VLFLDKMDYELKNPEGLRNYCEKNLKQIRNYFESPKFPEIFRENLRVAKDSLERTIRLIDAQHKVGGNK